MLTATALGSGGGVTLGTTTGGSAVGVGGGETGQGKEDALDELLLPLLVLPAVTDEESTDPDDDDDDVVVDEQSDPHLEPDSRRWLSMCDVRAAAVL